MLTNSVMINYHEKDYSNNFMEYARAVSKYCRIPDTCTKEKAKYKFDFDKKELIENKLISGDDIPETLNFEISYEKIISDPKNCWIVMIHGFGGDSSSWSYQISKLLKNNFNVLILDLYGHGNSNFIENVDYDVKLHVFYLNKIIESVTKEKFFLVGFSYGGIICQLYAKEYQSKLNALILVSSFSHKDKIFENILSSWQETLCLNTNDNNEAYIKKIMYKLTISSIFSSHYIENNSSSLKMLENTYVKKNYQLILRNEVTHLLNFDSSNFLKDITIPTIIICGVHDKLFSTNISLTLHHSIKTSKRFIFFSKHASHSLNIEIFSSFNKILINQLKKIQNNKFRPTKLPFHVHCETRK